MEIFISSITYFYPRPPRGGRPFTVVSSTTNAIFLSTPSARRATASPSARMTLREISIHALREEGDEMGRNLYAISCHFYPRPPRGGRRSIMSTMSRTHRFLSTPSARRATEIKRQELERQSHFYPRPPRGGRPCRSRSAARSSNFYPRPPRGGRLSLPPKV